MNKVFEVLQTSRRHYRRKMCKAVAQEACGDAFVDGTVPAKPVQRSVRRGREPPAISSMHRLKWPNKDVLE